MGLPSGSLEALPSSVTVVPLTVDCPGPALAIGGWLGAPALTVKTRSSATEKNVAAPPGAPSMRMPLPLMPGKVKVKVS